MCLPAITLELLSSMPMLRYKFFDIPTAHNGIHSAPGTGFMVVVTGGFILNTLGTQIGISGVVEFLPHGGMDNVQLHLK